MSMKDETTRQNLASFLWRREGGHCVSYLVSTIASGYDAATGDLGELCEQAYELCAPLDDYEEAARYEIGKADREQLGEWLNYSPEGETDEALRERLIEEVEDDFATFCNEQRIEPNQREVFEHWIITKWLADKLEARGEKVCRDFGDLTVWARCTTGQSIALDGVIQEIALSIWPTPEDQARILKGA